MHVWTNWAGNLRSVSARVTRPTSRDEVVAAVRAAAGDGFTVKAVGGGHSFNPIAVTTGLRLHLDALADPVRIDRGTRLVTVDAGMPLHRLNALLDAHGLALPSLGDTTAQTIAGALATGTHGSANLYGSLPSRVEAMELVTADGTLLRCDAEQHPEVLAAARLGLGALGVVTEVTLRCVDAFTLHADEHNLLLYDLLAGLDQQLASTDHLELRWLPYTERVRLIRRRVVAASDRPASGWQRWLFDDFLGNTVPGAACRIGRRHPGLQPALSRVAAGVVPARRYTGPSHTVFAAPQRVRFVAMEYAVPRPALRDLLDGVRSIVDHLPFRVSFPVKVRFSPPDDVWLSPSYQRETAHVLVAQFAGTAYEEYFRRVEALATSLDGRPHWGTVHWRDAASLRAAYPRFDQMLAVRHKLDPGRMFTNPYLDRVLGP